MIISEPLELKSNEGQPSGRWRVVDRSDEDATYFIERCLCADGHETREAANACLRRDTHSESERKAE